MIAALSGGMKSFRHIFAHGWDIAIAYSNGSNLLICMNILLNLSQARLKMTTSTDSILLVLS